MNEKDGAAPELIGVDLSSELDRPALVRFNAEGQIVECPAGVVLWSDLVKIIEANVGGIRTKLRNALGVEST